MKYYFTVVFCVLFFSPFLFAQEIRQGHLELSPRINLALQHDDNVTRASSNEISSLITVSDLELQMKYNNAGDEHQLVAGVEAGNYFDSSDDNYVDAHLLGDAYWQLTRRLDLALQAHYLKEHDPRGSNDLATHDKPYKKNLGNLGFVVGYGRLIAKARVEAGLDYQTTSYQDDDVSKLEDRKKLNFSTRMFYRLMPKTRLVLETQYANIRYDLNKSLDSDQYSVLAGITWDATAHTTGIARLGYSGKNFKQNSREDFSGVDWDLGVKWSPRTYTQFELLTSRDTVEASGFGDYADVNQVSLDWTYFWTFKLSSKVSIAHVETDFGATDRTDKKNSLSLGVDYKMRRWLTLSIETNFNDRDSTLASKQYDRSLFMFMVSMYF